MSKGTEFDQKMLEALNQIEQTIQERLEDMRRSVDTLERIESNYTQKRLGALAEVNNELARLISRVDAIEDRINKRRRYDMDR